MNSIFHQRIGRTSIARSHRVRHRPCTRHSQSANQVEYSGALPTKPDGMTRREQPQGLRTHRNTRKLHITYVCGPLKEASQLER